MKHANLLPYVLAIILTAAGAAITPLGGGDYDLGWYTFDGGGGTSSGGAYELRGTIGQHDPGVMGGGDFALAGGFWSFTAAPTPLCAADINGDAVVDVVDLLAVLSAWGAAGGPGDINSDGVVDVLDLLEVIAAWGPC